MESERLKSEITSRNDLLTRIDSETTVVEVVRAGHLVTHFGLY